MAKQPTRYGQREKNGPGFLTGFLSLFTAICAILCMLCFVFDSNANDLITLFFAQVLAVVSLILLVASYIRWRRNRQDDGSSRFRKASLILLAVFVMLMLTGVPPIWREYKEEREISHCALNQDFIDRAKERYQMANPQLKDGAIVTWDQLAPYLTWPKSTFVCFTAGSNTYAVGKLGEGTSCSIHGGPGHWHYPDGRPAHY